MKSGMPVPFLYIYPIPLGLVSAYLIESAEGLFLVDAGLPHWENVVLRRIRALGRKPDELQLIYITHAHLDHYGSAAALRRATGAPIAIHRADADAMAQGETRLGSIRSLGWLLAALLPLANQVLRPEPTLPDLLLDDGDVLDLGLSFNASVLHTPGHTPGSSCLIIEKKEKDKDKGRERWGQHDQIVFAGDLVSQTVYPHGQRYLAHDWDLLSNSLDRLQNLCPQFVYPGHGPGPLDEAAMRQLA